MLHLSKSKYCASVRCPKAGWLTKHKPEVFDTSLLNTAVMEMGNEVGDLAMGLLGDYVEVPYGDLSDMIAKTQALIDAGTPVIAEASFSYNGLFCSVDILKMLGGRRVEFVEVKSTTAINDYYYHDVAFQYYVLTGLGYEVARVRIAHIDPTYVRHGRLEPDRLFKFEDLTADARSMQDGVRSSLEFLEGYLARTDEPDEPIDIKCCASPLCGYFGYCTRNLPRPNVFDISGIQVSTKLKLFDRGIVSFEDVESTAALKGDKMLQVRHELHDLPPLVDRNGISAFLGQLSYPLYFLDFESFQSAIPPYDDTSPYQQIVFQYSLHFVEREGGELKHMEYLARPDGDPRRGLAEQLCRDIPLNACTMAYNMGFEKGRIRELARLYPDLSDHLMDIHDHIVDLMVPFRQRQYYCRAMQGSYSIKYVLPALFPDDPELDYHHLDGVHNGTEASTAFARMKDMSPEEAQNVRSQLLRYCGLDTLAMVRVWEKLRSAAGDSANA